MQTWVGMGRESSWAAPRFDRWPAACCAGAVGWLASWVLVCRFPFAAAQHSAPLPDLLQATGSAAQPQQQNFELEAPTTVCSHAAQVARQEGQESEAGGLRSRAVGRRGRTELSLASCCSSLSGTAGAWVCIGSAAQEVGSAVRCGRMGRSAAGRRRRPLAAVALLNSG